MGLFNRGRQTPLHGTIRIKFMKVSFSEACVHACVMCVLYRLHAFKNLAASSGVFSCEVSTVISLVQGCWVYPRNALVR
jgi:hypothetical protein